MNKFIDIKYLPLIILGAYIYGFIIMQIPQIVDFGYIDYPVYSYIAFGVCLFAILLVSLLIALIFVNLRIVVKKEKDKKWKAIIIIVSLTFIACLLLIVLLPILIQSIMQPIMIGSLIISILSITFSLVQLLNINKYKSSKLIRKTISKGEELSHVKPCQSFTANMYEQANKHLVLTMRISCFIIISIMLSTTFFCNLKENLLYKDALLEMEKENILVKIININDEYIYCYDKKTPRIIKLDKVYNITFNQSKISDFWSYFPSELEKME